MKKARRILAITGSRAEYGLARPILKAIHQDRDLSLELIVTAMHLDKKFGYSYKEIQKDGLKVVGKVPVNLSSDNSAFMAEGLGKQVIAFTRILARRKPDVCFVLTDLDHTLAGAIAGLHLNVPVAHLHGGDVSGTIDESIRHASTKLSHIHFPASRQSAERIRKMGEEPWRIHPVGAPGIDDIAAKDYWTPEQTRRYFQLDSQKPLLLFVLHPVVQEAKSAVGQIQSCLKVIKSLGYQTVGVYPNADHGREAIIAELQKAEKRLPFFQLHRNLSRQAYLGLLNIATVLVGNSSSGIIEAPAFGLPVVNIGSRQQGRERWLNVIDVPFVPARIQAGIMKAVKDAKWVRMLKKRRKESPYGNGQAGARVVKVLKNLTLEPKLLDKRMTY